MDVLSSVSVTFVVRWVHVLAMVIVVGGSASLSIMFLSPGGGEEPLQSPPRRRVSIGYEWAFWLAIGLLVLTGVGNAGAFAGHLPTPETVWGRKFVVKLFGVLSLILVSILRTYLVAQWGRAQELLVEGPARQIIGGAYAATALLALAVLTVALSLTHG